MRIHQDASVVDAGSVSRVSHQNSHAAQLMAAPSAQTPFQPKRA
jgi:hypothetical protein